MHKLAPMAAVAAALMFAAPIPNAAAQSDMTDGVVTKIDQAGAKITIRHGPIKKFDMDGMTMVFRVQDPEMLKQVKPGDKIKFDADRVDGQFTVMKMQKAR
jgi:Cu(I)/Ag(I) efflux system periplasmic protein CusF